MFKNVAIVGANRYVHKFKLASGSIVTVATTKASYHSLSITKSTTNTIDFYFIGGVDAYTLPAIHEWLSLTDPQQSKVAVYWSNEDAYALCGSKDALSEIKDIKDISFPISRAKTTKKFKCPMQYLIKDQHFFIDIYHPELDILSEDIVEVIISAVRKELDVYGVKISHPKFAKGHLLIQRIGLKYSEVGRVAQDGNRAFLLLHLNTDISKFLSPLLPLARIRDIVVIPKSGICDSNSEITMDISERIASNVTKSLGLSSQRKELGSSQEQKIIEYKPIFSSENWTLHSKLDNRIGFSIERKDEKKKEIIGCHNY